MPRTIRFLAVLLVLQLGLAAAMLARKNPLSASTPTALLLPASVSTADQVIIESKPATGATADSTRIELKSENGHWILPGYFNAPASDSKLHDLLTRLAGLKRGLPIATSASALKRFKLVDGDFERRMQFEQKGKLLSTLYVGSSPGLRKSDARTAQDSAVYAIDLATYDVPTQISDWFDGDLLRREPDSIVGLEVSHGAKDQLSLGRPAASTGAQSAQKTPAVWSATGLSGTQKLDAAKADALAHSLAQLHVDAVLGTDVKPDWQQEHPQLTLKITDAKAQGETWTLSKPSTGDYYVLKSSAHPWYLSLSSYEAKPLLDGSARDALLVIAPK